MSGIAAAIEKLLPHSLPMRLGIVMGFVVCLSFMTLASLVETKGQEALLEEKSAKLYGVARLLDSALGDLFILSGATESLLRREQKIALLHDRVAQIAETAAQAYPGIGVGYYHRELDAIIAYAPQRLYGYSTGQTIAAAHPGREIMRRMKADIAFGSQFRGNIMNAMIPIIRNDKVLGYIWANELLDDVRKQMKDLHQSVLAVTAGGLTISLMLVAVFSYRFGRAVGIVKSGLRKLRYNLGTLLPPLKGEIGEIACSVNEMAESLRAARSLNESILESIDEAVIIVDAEGRVAMLNPAAWKITGFIPEETLHRHYRDFFVAHPQFFSPLLDTLHNGVVHKDIEIDYPVAGGILHIAASTSLIRNREGKTIGATVFLRDLTKQKTMQRHMERAERLAALGELAAGMAHELRNPLTTIRGFVQYLQHEGNARERRDYTEIILKEVDSINKLIQKLLNFAKPAPQHCLSIRLVDLVQEVLILVRTREVSSRIDFVQMIDAHLPDIEADGETLKQTLLNLLLNAVQSIKETGRITITVGRNGADRVKIAIGDSGCGISKADREKIFTPFFTTKRSGTGLGLPIVQRIVSAHNGQISIDDNVGKGTVVTLDLPVHQKPRKEEPKNDARKGEA